MQKISMSNHHVTGKIGESIAVEFLRKKQYEILCTNWWHKHVDIDIIAYKGNTVIFVEVKTRRSNYYGYPEDAVDAAKQANLQKAAEAYLEKNNIDSVIRFDIISILLNKNEPEIYHIEDAFFSYDE